VPRSRRALAPLVWRDGAGPGDKRSPAALFCQLNRGPRPGA